MERQSAYGTYFITSVCVLTCSHSRLYFRLYFRTSVLYFRLYSHAHTPVMERQSGCKCTTSSFTGHQEAKTSLLNLHEMKVSQADECVISITVLEVRRAGGPTLLHCHACALIHLQSGSELDNWKQKSVFWPPLQVNQFSDTVSIAHQLVYYLTFDEM